MLAISMDTPDDSRAFAADYHLPFWLLTDADGAVSRTYAGVTSDANTLPGVTIVRPDGHIAFRQVATAKDDRLSTNDLLAALDRTLGTSGQAAYDLHSKALDRTQLRVELGGGALLGGGEHGVVHDGVTRGTGIGAIAGYVALGRRVLLGPRVEIERDAPLDLEGVLTVRQPLWAGAGAIELGLGGGWAPWGPAAGPLACASAGLWFAMAPTWALSLRAGVTVHDTSDAHATDIAGTFGIAKLFGR